MKKNGAKSVKMSYGRPGSVYGLVNLLIMICITMFQLLASFTLLNDYDSEYFTETVIIFSAYAIIEWVYFFVFAIVINSHIGIEMTAFTLSSISLFLTAGASPEKLKVQFIAVIAGLIMFIAMVQFMRDTKRTAYMRIPMAIAAIGLLGLTYLIAEPVNGAKNWVYFHGISIQPSEIVKLAFIYVGAATLDKLQNTRSLLSYIAFSVACVGLLFLMFDFGTALIFFATFILIAFMRSGDIKTLFLIGAAALLGGILIITVKPYVLSRFQNYRHIWEYMNSSGYQQTRTLIYFASGGFFGVGLGKGYLRNVFAASEDLVFGLMGEEMGMLTAFLVVFTIAALSVYAVYNAKYARSTFFSIASCAAAGMLLIQTALNVFGVTDFLPMTGVTLPFISRGGSSMICAWGLLAFIKAADSRSYPGLFSRKKAGKR